MTFESPDSAVNVLAQPVHVLDEKQVSFSLSTGGRETGHWGMPFVKKLICGVQIDPKPAEMKSAAKPLQSMVVS